MEYTYKLKKLISEKLKEQQRTITWLALEIDMNVSSLSNLLSGNTEGTRFETGVKMCVALNIDLNEIFKPEKNNVVELSLKPGPIHEETFLPGRKLDHAL